MRGWLLAGCVVVATAAPARAHRLNVEARLEAGRAVVEVYFGDGTRPEGAEVVVTRDGVEVARGRTDATGRFWFAPAAPGRHAIAVTEPGLHRGQAALDVAPGDLVAAVTTRAADAEAKSGLGETAASSSRTAGAARGADAEPKRVLTVEWRGLLAGLLVIGGLAAGLAALQRRRRGR